MAIHAIALFCEDSRQEVGGTETIVGVFKDNMTVPPQLPGAFVKMTVYVRVHFDTTEDPTEVVGEIRTPWGEVFKFGENSLKLSAESLERARANGMPTGGIILRTLFAPFPVQKLGLISVVVTIKGEERVIGLLNLKSDETSPPIASAPPASQSPNA